MDFWASLEHKIYYKFEGNAPEYISRDLRECAKMVSELDEKMLSLNEAIQECIAHQQNRDNMDDVLDHVIGNRKNSPDYRIISKKYKPSARSVQAALSVTVSFRCLPPLP